MLLFVKYLLPIFKFNSVSSPAFDHFVAVHRFRDIFTVSIGKNFAHVDSVVMNKICPPPFNLVPMCFVIRGYTHQRKVWKVVTINVYQSDSHG